jgi:hypothetical protein
MKKPEQPEIHCPHCGEPLEHGFLYQAAAAATQSGRLTLADRQKAEEARTSATRRQYRRRVE